jgi:hypothetical protein
MVQSATHNRQHRPFSDCISTQFCYEFETNKGIGRAPMPQGERLKKYCSHSERGFLEFWRGFGEGAGLKNPVTEPKRSQKPKRPLLSSEWLQHF